MMLTDKKLLDLHLKMTLAYGRGDQEEVERLQILMAERIVYLTKIELGME